MVPAVDVQCVALFVTIPVAFARNENFSYEVCLRCAYELFVDQKRSDSKRAAAEASDAYCHRFVSPKLPVDLNRILKLVIERCRAYNVKWDERAVNVKNALLSMVQLHINYDVDWPLATVVLVGNVILALNYLIYMIPKMPIQYHCGRPGSMYCQMMACSDLLCDAYDLDHDNLTDYSHRVRMNVFALKLIERRDF